MRVILKFAAIILTTGTLFTGVAAAQDVMGDASSGESIFNKKCKVCHTTDKGGKAKVGPNLYGVHNMKAGQVDGYKYSKGLIAADLTWDDATLAAYLTKPRDVVKRGKMIFAGLRKEQERQDMIAYLKTLQD